MVLARLMCCSTIFTELGVVPAIFISRLQYWAICANILFQSGLLLFTGTTFTLFFYGMSAASLAFVSWPSGPLPVIYDAGRSLARRAKRFSQFWHLEGMFVWTAGASRSWMELRK